LDSVPEAALASGGRGAEKAAAGGRQAGCAPSRRARSCQHRCGSTMPNMLSGIVLQACAGQLGLLMQGSSGRCHDHRQFRHHWRLNDRNQVLQPTTLMQQKVSDRVQGDSHREGCPALAPMAKLARCRQRAVSVCIISRPIPKPKRIHARSADAGACLLPAQLGDRAWPRPAQGKAWARSSARRRRTRRTRTGRSCSSRRRTRQASAPWLQRAALLAAM